MKLHGLAGGAALAVAVVIASSLIVPSALAHTHVSIGIYVPGVTVGVGNCWRCGYRVAPPVVYYQPAYPAPVYYAPPAVYYYGYGYYAPHYGYYRYYRHDYRRHDHDGRYYHHRYRHWRGGYYEHGHH